MSEPLEFAVLGTDPWGWMNFQQLTADYNPQQVAMIGSITSEPEIDETLQRIPLDTASFDPGFYDQVNENRENFGFVGGKIVDLDRSEEGFHLAALRDDGEIEELYTHRLIATAPGGTDLVEDTIPIAGTDSVVSGLLIEHFSLEWKHDQQIWKDEGGQPLGFGSGFQTQSDGTTSEPGLIIGGLARAGIPEHLGSIPYPEQQSTESPTAEQSTFDWEDIGMPEGFVATKTRRLKKLMKTIIEQNDSNHSERLLQEWEGLAGEIDSYSRFRSDPALRRLRWKMLAGMNYARSYLLSSEASLA